MQVYPSLLTDDEATFKHQLELVKGWPQISVVQVDVVDGLYADNLSLNPIDLTVFEFADKKIDFHLMSVEPVEELVELKNLKDHLPIRSVMAQVEKMSSQAEFIQSVKAEGWQVGLSLNLYTPLEAIDDQSWPELDQVQLMGIRAGFQGQEFNPAVLAEVERVVSWREQHHLNFEIIVDGGVKLDTVALLKKVGVDSVAVGSGLWQAPDPTQALAEFIKLS